MNNCFLKEFRFCFLLMLVVVPRKVMADKHFVANEGVDMCYDSDTKVVTARLDNGEWYKISGNDRKLVLQETVKHLEKKHALNLVYSLIAMGMSVVLMEASDLMGKAGGKPDKTCFVAGAGLLLRGFYGLYSGVKSAKTVDVFRDAAQGLDGYKLVEQDATVDNN
jgi:hypothetical protein